MPEYGPTRAYRRGQAVLDIPPSAHCKPLHLSTQITHYERERPHHRIAPSGTYERCLLDAAPNTDGDDQDHRRCTGSRSLDEGGSALWRVVRLKSRVIRPATTTPTTTAGTPSITCVSVSR